MTEREYMLAANVARCRAMKDILRVADPMEGILSVEEWQELGRQLRAWGDALKRELDVAGERTE